MASILPELSIGNRDWILTSNLWVIGPKPNTHQFISENQVAVNFMNPPLAGYPGCDCRRELTYGESKILWDESLARS